jgi:hypothetical protein
VDSSKEIEIIFKFIAEVDLNVLKVNDCLGQNILTRYLEGT